MLDDARLAANEQMQKMPNMATSIIVGLISEAQEA